MKNFDELLDEVLHRDGRTTARPGLEARVMARLHADERPTVRSLKAWWWTAMAMAAAACVVAAVVWVVPWNGNDSAPQVQRPVVITKPEASRPRLTTPQAKLAGTHVSDDKTVAKMERQAVVAPKVRRSRAVAQNSLPKLQTFPAVTQKGDAADWLGEGGDSKLVAAVKEMSPQTVKAYQELREAQNRPLNIAAIEIKSLQ